MENRKHIQVLGYIALYFFPKYQNDDVTGGGGGRSCWKNAKIVPDEEGILSIWIWSCLKPVFWAGLSPLGFLETLCMRSVRWATKQG